MIDAGRQENVVVGAHDVVLAVDFHQAFALKHVIDLLCRCSFTWGIGGFIEMRP